MAQDFHRLLAQANGFVVIIMSVSVILLCRAFE